MVKVEKHVTIARPIEEVFEFVADARNDHLWNPSVQDAGQTPEGPFVPGVQVWEVREFLGRPIRSVSMITEVRAPEHIAFEVDSGPVPYDGVYTFAEQDGATHLTVVFQVHPEGLFKAAQPLIAGAIRRDIENSFDRLKLVLEAQPA